MKLVNFFRPQKQNQIMNKSESNIHKIRAFFLRICVHMLNKFMRPKPKNIFWGHA